MGVDVHYSSVRAGEAGFKRAYALMRLDGVLICPNRIASASILVGCPESVLALGSAAVTPPLQSPGRSKRGN
jgi:hypothetical protein